MAGKTPPDGPFLPNDEAAIAYGRIIFRDLKRVHDHPSLTLLVQNIEGKTISSIADRARRP